jgi:bifunctional non-homologous end joining protein LigD
MKAMLPTLSFEIPKGNDWVYETKYDGFRAFLIIEDDEIQLMSRNGKSLLKQFPEALAFYKHYKNQLRQYVPLILDGELTILENPYKSNFFAMQKRGRLRSEQKISDSFVKNPAIYMAFDLLQLNGKNITNKSLFERKKRLKNLLQNLKLPLHPNETNQAFVQYVPYQNHFDNLWKKIKQWDGEGVIAKNITSKWEEGKRTTNWIKYKNWKKIHCFITKYDKVNGYFHVAVYNNKEIYPIGLFKHGLSQEEHHVLVRIMEKNAKRITPHSITMDPAICIELFYLQYYEETLREPYFSKFLLEEKPANCTFEQLFEIQPAVEIEITHPEKPLWKKIEINKKDYISYLKQIYPYIAPFLANRTLTVIRYPHGIFGEPFYQKNCPDYAPEFVDTYHQDGIQYIVCNHFETFLWLGNQLAIEFHIPFHTIDKNNPTEIVIDLDPPSKQEFSWAVEAANYIKEEFVDKLGLKSFLKVSGNRGLQIYFPVSGNHITWEDAHLFTQFIAKFLIAKNEAHFTIERMKKKRGHRLYVDYIQHAEGKTIIAPFSVRGNENAGVAAPIDWEELSQISDPDSISIFNMVERLRTKGNPFANFFQVNNDEALLQIIQFLKRKS